MVDTARHRLTDKAQHVLLHGQNDALAVLSLLIDNTSHGLVLVPHEHHEVHEGAAFRYNDAITLGAAATQDYLLTVANTPSWPHFQFSVDGTAITTIEVFRGTDKNGTTLQATFNANENSANTAGMTIHKSTSGGTTDGTLIFRYSSGTATGGAKSSGIDTYSAERILKQNTKYIIRITSGTAGNLCNIRCEWYEHTSMTTG